jgi:hypothetical protein
LRLGSENADRGSRAGETNKTLSRDPANPQGLDNFSAPIDRTVMLE